MHFKSVVIRKTFTITVICEQGLPSSAHMANFCSGFRNAGMEGGKESGREANR